MRELSAQGIEAPEVGFEMTDAAGEVVAEAELAWEAKRIVVLLPIQDSATLRGGRLASLPPRTPLAWLRLSRNDSVANPVEASQNCGPIPAGQQVE